MHDPATEEDLSSNKTSFNYECLHQLTIYVWPVKKDILSDAGQKKN